jgi:hypothetical protein
MEPHTLLPFFDTVLDPSPIMKLPTVDVKLAVKMWVEAGIVPAKLLFVRVIPVRRPPVHVVPKNLV